MRNIEQLSNFLKRVTTDASLSTSHISMCTALCAIWMENQFVDAFNVSRSRLMRAARIKSKTTYHKVMNDLYDLKYLIYTPSYHPGKGTEIRIVQ